MPPFYSWGNKGIERLRLSNKVTQIVNVELGFELPSSGFKVPSYHMLWSLEDK